MKEEEFKSKSCVSGKGGWIKEDLQLICTNLGIKFKKSDNKKSLCDKIDIYFKKKTKKQPIKEVSEPTRLPVEMFLEILRKSSIEDLKSLCATNKLFNSYCKANEEYIIKMFLKRYNVKYEDPNNFIYFTISVKKAKDIIKQKDYKTMFRMYYKKCYRLKSFEYYKYRERPISTIPTMPLLRFLRCSKNILTEISEMPSLEVLECDNNKLKSLPDLEYVKELVCNNNEIEKLPKMKTVKYMNCSDNKLIKLQEDLKYLDTLICDRNKITSLSMYPSLKSLSCAENKLKSIPAYPKLKTLDCSSNEIIELPQFPKLESLICSNNQLRKLEIYPSLKYLEYSGNIGIQLPEIESLPAEIQNVYR
jgi:Leucine-rich repeat (LRR) protein